jgi:cation diffusion facilitator CzcD-associated flavoprotein CzcO
VASLSLFQRTPAWIIPKGDRRIGPLEQALLRWLPGARSLWRLSVFAINELRGLAFRKASLMEAARRQALDHLHAQISDPQLRGKLTPDYMIGCKRVLVSNDFYPAMNRQNVSLVTEPITSIQPEGIETADGAFHPADVLVLATGFRPMDMAASAAFCGVGGQSLADVWGKDIQKAYLGIAMPGFPNLFFLMGPNTGLGHNSMIYMIETQIDWVLKTLDYLDSERAVALDVRPEALEAWQAGINKGLKGTVWSAGCRSWYMSADGRNPAIWPDLCIAYRSTVMAAPASDWVKLQ